MTDETTDGSTPQESSQIDPHFCKQCKEITSHLTVERGVWHVFHFFDRECLTYGHIWHLGDDDGVSKVKGYQKRQVKVPQKSA